MILDGIKFLVKGCKVLNIVNDLSVEVINLVFVKVINKLSV